MSCLPIATQAEAEAGSANDKAMTPLRTKQAIDALGVSQTVLASSGGGDLVGTSRGNTVDGELTWARAATPASINEFYDASNGTAADRLALEGALGSGRVVSFRGLLTLDQPITMPAGSIINGEGASSYWKTDGRSCIRRGFDGVEPLIVMMDNCQLRNLDFDGDERGNGDLVKVKGARVVIDNVSLRKAGRDNLRIGGDNEHLNANGWRIAGLRSYKAGRYGFYCHHTNDDVGATFPLGAPDVNGGTMIGGDFLLCQDDNFVVGNAIDNIFYGPMSQSSGKKNFHLLEGAWGHKFFGIYDEVGAQPSTMGTGSKGNSVLFSQGASIAPWTDNGDGNTMVVYIRAINVTAYSRSMAIAAEFGSGEGAHLDLIDDNWGLAAQIFGRQTGVGTQGKGVAAAKRNGNTPIDIFEWVDGQGINILSGGLRVAGSQVVGAQQGAIGNAGSGDEVTKINAILAALRAHGMIAA